MTRVTELPAGNSSGVEALWVLPVTGTDGAPDSTLELEGRFLGMGSSRTQRHWPHAGAFATKEERCGWCRWYEARIFRVQRNEYVLHHAGCSIVPDEITLCRYEKAYSPQEVIERYVVRKAVDKSAFLPRPAARALAQAAAFDEDLQDAYENRAVI
jgi:hypothetical protein